MGNINRGVILAKIETPTYGTDASPGATEAIVVGTPSLTVNGEKIERNAVSPSMSPWPHAIGMKDVEISFDVDLRGYGAAYSASNLPEVSPLLRACGMEETLDQTVGLEKVTYQPVSTGFDSCTIYYYDDGFLYKLLGCRGDVEFPLEVGKAGVAKFKFQALYSSPADGTLIDPTFQDTSVTPPLLLSAALSIGGYSPVANKLDLKLANSLAKRTDANSATGVKEIIINGRAPAGSVDPEAAALTTKDVFAEWENGTAQAVTATLGGTQYNRVTFTAPRCVYDSVGLADREKLRAWEIPFVCARDTGDDELVITFD